VHGAKGLEADIVILPDTTSLPQSSSTKGHLLYTNGAVLFPVADRIAPENVKLAKQAVQDETLKEHRRLLYVALTRAKERLYICGFENKSGRKPGSWHALAERAAEKLGTEAPDGDDTIRVYGDAAESSAEHAVPITIESTTVPDWARTPPPTEQPTPWLIRPSLAAGADEPAMPSPLEQTARFKRGLLVHAMLAHLPEIARERRETTTRNFLRAQGVDEAECATLSAETLAVLDHPAFAPAFAANSRAEVSIVADLPELGPGARVHGRVDRLAVADDSVLIVDFKTNRPPPAREEDMPAIYATQMALYRAAAAKIFPGKRIVCALVWTEGPRLMPLSDAFLDTETGRIRARLDRGVSRS